MSKLLENYFNHNFASYVGSAHAQGTLHIRLGHSSTLTLMMNTAQPCLTGEINIA
jgi:hypothetical protein